MIASDISNTGVMFRIMVGNLPRICNQEFEFELGFIAQKKEYRPGDLAIVFAHFTTTRVVCIKIYSSHW